MVSLEMAQQLRGAGLKWQPELHDFFVIPDADLDGRVFVLTDMMAYQERLHGRPVVTFHGAVEWALDFILTADVVWLPTEAQVRELLVARLAAEGPTDLTLSTVDGGYRCALGWRGEARRFEARTAADAYARALLDVLGDVTAPRPDDD